MRCNLLCPILLVLNILIPAQVGMGIVQLRNVDWEGLTLMSTRAMEHAVVGMIDYHSYAYAGADRESFVAGVEGAVREICRAQGYFKVEVVARIAAEGLQIKVTEGSLYRKGVVVISGNKTLSTIELKAALLGDQNHSSDEAELETFWVAGTILKGRLVTEIGKERLEHAYRSKGRRGVVVRASLVARTSEARVVDLVIHVEDEGRLVKIHDVIVKGDSRESVVDLVGLSDGATWDVHNESRTRSRLAATGRYTDINLAVYPEGALAIKLTKLPCAPEFSAMPKVRLEILRMARKWLGDFARARRTLRVRTPAEIAKRFHLHEILVSGGDFVLRSHDFGGAAIGYVDGAASLVLPRVGMLVRLPAAKLGHALRVILDRRATSYSLVWGLGITSRTDSHLDLIITDQFLLALALE